MTDIKLKLLQLDDQVTKYTRSYPKSFRKATLLKEIENGMKSLLKDIKNKEDGAEYNKLIGRLNDWYSDPKFSETYQKRKPRLPDVQKYEMSIEEEEKEDDTERPQLMSNTPGTSTFTPGPETPMVDTPMGGDLTPMEGDITDNLLDLETPRMEMTGESKKEKANKERNRKRRERKKKSDLGLEIEKMTKKLKETKKEQEKTIKKLEKEKDAKMKAKLEKEIKRLEMRNKEIKEEIIREIDEEEERKEDVEEEEKEDVKVMDLDVEEMDLADIEDVASEMDLADIEDVVDEEEMDLADIEDVEEIDLADIEDVEEEEEEEKKEDEISPEMEEFHDKIRKDEREKVMREFNLVDPTIGSIDIPKERLGIEGKTIKILNDDIKYFIKRFPDILKMEASVYKKTNKKNKKALQDLHRRIQAKLSPDPKKEDEGGKVGIILDADKFIDMKITELLAAKTLEGLTPSSLVDITEEPKSKGRDVGSYTLTRRGGRDIINNAPVYRAIPSTQPKQPKRRGEISQSTIYKNSGKTKVDIAKMEMRDNPFIRESKPKRLNIIL